MPPRRATPRRTTASRTRRWRDVDALIALTPRPRRCRRVTSRARPRGVADGTTPRNPAPSEPAMASSRGEPAVAFDRHRPDVVGPLGVLDEDLGLGALDVELEVVDVRLVAEERVERDRSDVDNRTRIVDPPGRPIPRPLPWRTSRCRPRTRPPADDRDAVGQGAQFRRAHPQSSARPRRRPHELGYRKAKCAAVRPMFAPRSKITFGGQVVDRRCTVDERVDEDLGVSRAGRRLTLVPSSNRTGTLTGAPADVPRGLRPSTSFEVRTEDRRPCEARRTRPPDGVLSEHRRMGQRLGQRLVGAVLDRCDTHPHTLRRRHRPAMTHAKARRDHAACRPVRPAHSSRIEEVPPEWLHLRSHS